MNYIFSKFLRTQEKRGIIAIFHNLHPCPIYLKKSLWKIIEKNPKKLSKDLIKIFKQQKLIINSYKKDIEELKKIKTSYERKINQVTNLYLILTYDCNLKCKYCFIPKSFHKKERKIMMLPETAKKGIDLWARHITKNSIKNNNYSIIFYGGEPLMNLSVLQESLDYIKNLQNTKKLPKNIKKIIVSNGILMNDKIANLLKKHEVEVTISIDGPSKFHDICRIDKKNRGTFKKVEKSIKILQSKRIIPFISTTITPYNIKIIKKFIESLSKIGIKGIGLNKLVGKTLFLLKSKINLENYNRQADQEIINVFLSARNKKIYEERLGQKVDSFMKKEFYPEDCKGYGGQIVIQPDGWISNCHASPKYKIKHIEKNNNIFLIKNEKLVKNWRKRLPLYNQKCLNCKAISICGGGCPWSVEEIKNNLMKKDDASCTFIKKAFDFIIWDYYDRLN